MTRTSIFLLFLITLGLVTVVAGVTAYFSKEDAGTSFFSKAAENIPEIATPNALQIQLTSFTEFEQLSLQQVQTATDGFRPNTDQDPQWGLTVYEMKFNVEVENGELEPVVAEVFVPNQNGQPNQQEFPLLVYGSGTTGIDDRCAPSRESQSYPNMGNYRNQMIAQAGQGFIVVLPNYEGLDNPERLHYYFIADSEARTLLGAADRVVNSQETQQLPIKDDTVFFGGYSQGGHAVFAAADYAQKFTPNLKIGGIIGHGPTTDITDFLRSNPNLAPYFTYSYRAYYPDIDATKILSNRWLARLDNAGNLCVNEAFAYNSTNGRMMYQTDFWDAINSEDADQNVQQKYPELYNRFKQNDAGTSYRSYPTLILQGTADPIVTYEDQQTFMNTLCDRSIPVTLKTYQGMDHFGIRETSFSDTNEWIRQVSDNQRPENNCS